jgi:pSer/pThr/pTyr-binding forkhead associated (FHA) protein
VGPNFKLIQKNNPQTCYETRKESFLLGKSDKCEIVITDPEVSEVQAKVGKKDEKYFIKNLGPEPILINGTPTDAQYVKDGDEIKFGETEFHIQLSSREEAPIKPLPVEDQTMVMTTPSQKKLGPHLVCTNSAGISKTYPLKKGKVIIGRSSEAHLKLVHPLVSRKHCMVEKRDNAFFIRNISTTNPLSFNDHDISEKRLYAGDQLKIGTFSLTFVSDRPEDVRLVEKEIITQKKRPVGALIFAIFLVLVLGGYLLYSQAYKPWKTKNALKSISKQIDSGSYFAAQKTLKQMLNSDLSPKNAHKTMELLTRTALAISQDKFQNEDLDEAKKYLKAYLAEYGAWKEAGVLWDRLDYYRLSEGQRLENSGKSQLALQQYSAIRENSMYFLEAQKAMRRIWLAYHQSNHAKQTLAQLLKEAEIHFEAKRYLTPVNQNAYAIYQAILALEPKNKLALLRINQIKTFYKEHGEKNFENENWSRALTFFERYYFIDPEAREIQEKIIVCRKKLNSSKSQDQKSDSATAASGQKKDDTREEIKRLLEESGTESSWIMQYLFEDPADGKKSDTPWE